MENDLCPSCSGKKYIQVIRMDDGKNVIEECDMCSGHQNNENKDKEAQQRAIKDGYKLNDEGEILK